MSDDISSRIAFLGLEEENLLIPTKPTVGSMEDRMNFLGLGGQSATMAEREAFLAQTPAVPAAQIPEGAKERPPDLSQEPPLVPEPPVVSTDLMRMSPEELSLVHKRMGLPPPITEKDIKAYPENLRRLIKIPLQIAGGLTAGMLEWGGLASANITRANQALGLGVEFEEFTERDWGKRLPPYMYNTPIGPALKAIDDAWDYLLRVKREKLNTYFGEPDEPEAQKALQAFGWFIGNTVGWAGEYTKTVVQGATEEMAKHVAPGEDSQRFARNLAAWAGHVSKFVVEYYAFRLGAKVAKAPIKVAKGYSEYYKLGRYIGEKARERKSPPPEAGELRTPESDPQGVGSDLTDIVKSIERDFAPKEIARKTAKVVEAEEAPTPKPKEKPLTAEQRLKLQEMVRRDEGLRLKEAERAQERAKATEDLYRDALRMQEEGTLLESPRANELRKGGVPEEYIERRILGDLATRLREQRASAVRLYTGEQQLAQATHAIKAAAAAAEDGRIPTNYIGSHIDAVTRQPVPFGNAQAARRFALKRSQDGGGIYLTKKVPGIDAFVLTEAEAPGRLILGKSGEGYATEKGVKRYSAVLESKGVSNEIVPIEGGRHAIKVIGYTKEAVKARIRELTGKKKAGKSETKAEVAERAPVEEPKVDFPPEPEPGTAEYQRAVLGDVLEAQNKPEAAEILRSRSDVELYAGLSTKLHAGLPPISREVLREIARLATEHGVDAATLLMRRGYEKAIADQVARMVADEVGTGPKYRSKAAPEPLRDTKENRKKLYSSTLAAAEAEGLLSRKISKEGPTFKQMEGAEYARLWQEYGEPGMTNSTFLRLLRDKGELRHKVIDATDFGLNDFSQKIIGKSFSKDLSAHEMRAVYRALLGLRQVEGKYHVMTEGAKIVTEADLDVVVKAADIQRQRGFDKFLAFWESPIWFATRMDQAVPGFAKIFFRNIQKAWKRSMHDFLVKRAEIRQLAKELRLGKKDMQEIGRYAIWKEPDGRAFLQKEFGMTERPKLTEPQIQFYNHIRDVYEDIYKQINQARAAAGIEPMGYEGDYFTFFRGVEKALESGVDLINSSAASIKKHMVHARQAFFQNAKPRKAASTLPIATNALRVMERYLLGAYRHIHLTPEISFIRTLISSKFNRDAIVREHGDAAWPTSLAGKKSFQLLRDNPTLHNYVDAYLNHIAGVAQDANMPVLRVVNRVASGFNRNMAFAILAYNIGSAVRQLAAGRHSLHALLSKGGLVMGTYDVLRGVGGALGEFLTAEKGKRFGVGKHLRGARLIGDVLTTRAFNISAEHIFATLEGRAAMGNFIYRLQEKAGKAGLRPLLFLDEIAAQVTWHAARHQGKRLGMSAKKAIEYAEDLTLKTQGSGSPIHIPPVLRNPAMRSILMFQTYVINEWYYLTREALGFKSAKPTLSKVKSVMLYVGVTAMMSELFEAAGIRSPFPTPIDAFNDSRRRGGSMANASLAAILDLVEPIPGIGGAIRYKSALGGPALDTANKLRNSIHGDPFAPPAAISMFKLLGVPGINAFWRLYRVFGDETDKRIRRRRLIKRRRGPKERPPRRL